LTNHEQGENAANVQCCQLVYKIWYVFKVLGI